jgi:phage-related protein
MAEIGHGYVRIVPTAEGIEGKISKLIAPETEKAGKEGGASLIDGLKGTLAKLGLGAIVGKAVKDSLEAGGALQQSFGGLDTLYGDASAAMKDYAMAAAQAGISANDYAEQAVSFGASLKSAFGGDTVKAAEAANTAIMDMADNSAKMGTDITAIQTAYQGFAKQNYTMLDNLKLGYGGTKTEMERLLKDAQKLSGVKYDINNLGDVYSAIHVIQENLGLTGVAAKEASETFTGSFNAMKASLTNLMASLTLGQDITPALQSLITSVSAFLFNNLVPMLWNILAGLPGAVSGAIPLVIDQLTTQFTTLLGGQSLGEFIQSGFDMFMGWVTGFLQGLPELITTAGTMISTLVQGYMQHYPDILSTAVGMIGQFIAGIGQALPGVLIAGAGMILDLLATIGENLPEFLQKGVELIGEVAAGIIKAIPDIVNKIPEVVTGIKNKFLETDWGQLGRDILSGIAQGIRNAGSTLLNAVGDAASGLLDSAKSFFKIGSPSKLMADEVGQWIPAGIAQGITDNLGSITGAMAEVQDLVAGDTAVNLTGNTYRPGEMYSPTEDLTKAIESNSNVNVTVVLQGDAEKLFKVVRKEDTKFKTSTGKSAFSY